MSNFLQICTLLLLALASISSSLDEKKFREIKYSEIGSTVDLKWMSSIKSWYIPLWSKLDKVRTAADLFETPVSKLTEKEWTTPTCGKFTGGNTIHAFGRKMTFDCQPIMGSTGSMEGFSCKAPWDGAIGFKFAFKLSDNKSYILALNEWDDGEASWAVISTTKTLPEKAKGQILHLVKGLGFREDKIVEENYAGCNIDKNEL